MLSSAATAQAVTDVVVMRRAIAPPRVAAAKPVSTRKRSCDMPPANTTLINYGANFDIGRVASVAAAHALCESADGTVGVCYVFKNASTSGLYVARAFASGTIVSSSGGSEFSGAGKCTLL